MTPLLNGSLAVDTPLGSRLGLQAGTAYLHATGAAQAITPLVDGGQRGLHQTDTMHVAVQRGQFQVLQQIRHRLVTTVVDAASQLQVTALLASSKLIGHFAAKLGVFVPQALA